MTCKFILGSRGSGKTYNVYQEIFTALATKKKVYLILPEQATFYHEKNIESYRQGRSIWNLEITSFRRLSEKHVHRGVLEPLGQRLALYRSILNNKDKFESFTVKEISPGLVDSILKALEEVLMNSLEPEEVKAKIKELSNREYSGDVVKKLKDIALIIDDIKGREKIFDGNLLLKAFKEVLSVNNPFEDSLFFFDDFSDFTAVEYELIGQLIALNIPLTFSFLWQADNPIFAKTQKAINLIESLATANDAPVRKTVLPAREVREELRFLAVNFLEGAGEYSSKADAVNMFHGLGPAGEIEGIAREICHLKEDGYINRDIALNFRDINPYLPYIKEVFPLYNIDYYLDDPVSLQNDPLFHYAGALLRLVTEGWSYSSVFSLAKSGLFPMSAQDCDEFENYCLAHGIKGKGFSGQRELTYIGERENVDLKYINSIRNSLRDFLLPLVKRLKLGKTAADYSVVIWDFIKASEADILLDKWRREQEEAGNLLQATALEASLVRLGELLDQIVLAFGNDPMTVQDFEEIFTMGCRIQKLRTIPQSTDAVEINILGQSRPAACKVSFLAGVNEGVFPNYSSVEGFFNRNDRDILAEEENFWSRSRSFFYHNENLLMYQGLSQAQDKLYISYATGGSDSPEGQAYAPSSLIYTIKKLFPHIEDREIQFGLTSRLDQGLFWSPQRVVTLLPWVMQWEDRESPWGTAAEILKTQESWTQPTDFALSSLEYTGQAKPLSGATLEKYLKNTLYMNVSSIDVYKRCPFSYYAKYGLKLGERKILQFDAPNLGKFYHDALRLLVEKMIEENIPWSSLPNRGQELITAIVEEKMDELGENTLFSPEKREFIANLIKDNLILTVDIMSRQILKGDQFSPIHCEASFGPGEEFTAKAYRLDDEEKEIILTGQIDRVDVASGEGRDYVRIIDYKTGDKNLKMDEIYYGLKLQLLIYLLVIENSGLKEASQPLEPGGVFYLSTKDIFINTEEEISDDKLAQEIDKQSQMAGYIFGDEESQALYPPDSPQKRLGKKEHDSLMAYLDASITKIGQEIFKGINTIMPYYRDNGLSCGFCPYETLCGYEEGLQGKAPILYPLKEEAAANKIFAALKGGGEG